MKTTTTTELWSIYQNGILTGAMTRESILTIYKEDKQVVAVRRNYRRGSDFSIEAFSPVINQVARGREAAQMVRGFRNLP